MKRSNRMNKHTSHMVWRYLPYSITKKKSLQEPFMCLLPEQDIPWEWLQKVQDYQVYENGMFWQIFVDPTPIVIPA